MRASKSPSLEGMFLPIDACRDGFLMHSNTLTSFKQQYLPNKKATIVTIV